MADTTDTSPAVPSATRDEVPAEALAGGRLLLGWALIGLAVILLFAGWLGVSRNPEVARQLAYFVSGGFGGMLSGIIGVGLLISDDIRRDRARLGQLEATVLELHQLVRAQSDALQDLSASRNGTGAERSPAKKTARKR